MLVIRDYDNNEHALRAVKVHTSELNGQDDLELTVHQQYNNQLDLKTIDKLWEIEYLNINYKIVYVKQNTKGDSFYLDIRAIPVFMWDFDKQIIHDNLDGSHTAADFFRTVFADSGYDYAIVDFSPSVEFQGLGKGETRKEMFKRGLDRYDYEFDIQGTTVYLRHLTGNDTNFMYKYKLNASNVSKTTDATAMFTHIKGFGNFEEGEEDYVNNAQLKRTFTHPLADVVTRPGKQPDEGKPIVDGRVTQTSTLDEMMRKAVEESLAVTVEGTLHDIRQMGYDIAVPLKGDRVFLIDERIDLKIEIRVHSVVTTYDERDNIIDCQVTFGSESIRGRHKADIATLSKNFADLLEGKLKLPRISLDNIARGMIESIHAASSEIVFGDFGMQAISKTNPNHVFGVNSEGWYISQDGGATPRTIATANGIYADALFAGTLWLTNDLNIEGQTGYLNITGERFIMRSKTNANNAVEITPDGISIHGFDGRELLIDGIMKGARGINIIPFNSASYLGREGGSDILFDGMNWFWTGSTGMHTVHYVDDQYYGRYVDLIFAASLRHNSPVNTSRIEITAVQLNGTVVASQNHLVTRDGGGSVNATLRIDLQALFGVVPDYRGFQFYIRVELISNRTAIGLFRINRGEFND